MFHYVLPGRIHPERTYVSFPGHEIPVKLIKSSGETTEEIVEEKINVGLSSINAQIVAWVEAEVEIEMDLLKNAVEELIRARVDYFGFRTGRGYDVEIISCLNLQNKNIEVFGVGLKEFEKEFEEEKEKSDPLIFNENYEIEANLVYVNIPLRRALHDLTQAIRIHKDTGFYCFRAIETLKEHFRKTPNEEDGILWKKMGNELNIDESFPKDIKRFSNPQRHGQFMPMTYEERIIVLKQARQVISRFIGFLKNGEESLNPSEFPPLANSS